MERNSSRCVGITLVTMVCLVLACITPSPVGAQIDCSTLPQWSAQQQQGQQVWVNQQHVFCGEFSFSKDGQVGFHSRPNGINPKTVGIFNMTSTPDARGIYEGRWVLEKFINLAPKFSSMFPDACSRDQVMNSIIYASAHQVPCPQGLPVNLGQGAICGVSGLINDLTYCNGPNGSNFLIAYYVLFGNQNFINSAFPLRGQNP